MEEEKKLYPLRFCTLEDSYGWGTECFKLADLGYRDSLVHDGWLAGNSIGEVMDTYMDRVVGEDVFERFGRQFPIQVKYLHINGKQPLRVHPDDETAQQRYDFLGKEKLWHIVSAEKDAVLYLGFKRDTDASAFWDASTRGGLEELLNAVPARKGESWLIPSGLVHGASGKMVIAEISESSPLDFCVHSWGQELSEDEFDSALPLTDALDFIDYSRFSGKALTAAADGTLTDGRQFSAKLFKLKNSLHIYSEVATGFDLYLCTSGKACVKEKDGDEYVISEGGVILVPSECPDITLSPMEEGTQVLEATVNALPEPDPYINPEASPTLPEDER